MLVFLPCFAAFAHTNAPNLSVLSTTNATTYGVSMPLKAASYAHVVLLIKMANMQIYALFVLALFMLNHT